MKINFLLIGEGSSDLRLTNHIENLLINEGFTEVSGDAPDLSLFPEVVGRRVKDKLLAIVRYFPHTDVVFVHRDADGVGVFEREKEIIQAAVATIDAEKIIPVIPTCMLETWLLADIDAIRRIAGNGKNKTPIGIIPSLSRLEEVKDSKQLLLDALCEASETQGARLKKFRSRFCEMRARLTTDLDPEGPVRSLPSYKRFREKVKEFSRIKLELV